MYPLVLSPCMTLNLLLRMHVITICVNCVDTIHNVMSNKCAKYMQIFRKGIDNIGIFKSRSSGALPWATFALPNYFNTNTMKVVANIHDLPADIIIALELKVLLGQPQPNWSLLLKVLFLLPFSFCVTK